MRKTKFGPVKLRHCFDYRVKWKDYPATWECQDSLTNCDDLVRDFYEQNKLEFIPTESTEQSKFLEEE